MNGSNLQRSYNDKSMELFHRRKVTEHSAFVALGKRAILTNGTSFMNHRKVHDVTFPEKRPFFWFRCPSKGS